ncbi:MAG: response regulator, partial [Myxococcota bacterium]
GFIEVDSEAGKGTTVHVYLPATAQQGSAPPSERAPAVLPAGDETVLIAEDDPVVRRMAVRLLEKNGYEVLEASNGEEALRVAHRHDGVIHALLTDVVMPRMGARELIDEIKKERPDIRIMLMSGYADDMRLRETADEQKIPFLGKPFTELVLVYKIRNLLDR